MVTFNLTDFEPVADRVWRAVAEPASVSIGLIAGSAGALVVDTGSSPAQGRSIRVAAERTAGVPVVAVVVTHHHYDHLFGLAAFADVATYGHLSLPESVRCHPTLAAELAALGVDRDEVAEANHPFGRRADVDLGGRLVRVVALGPAHTPGDAVVLVPDAGVVFAGDLVEEAGPPWVEGDSSVAGWVDALGVLDALFDPDAPGAVVVPGHGRPVGRSFVAGQREHLAGLLSGRRGRG